MKKLLFPSAIVVVMLSALSSAFGQGTAFTYQGQLTAGSNAANGVYDFQAELYAVASGGAAVNGPITNTGVAVSNGLFAMTLDFGSVFGGTTYWLALGVRTNGGATFVPLDPRQELTPTPYAITAESVDGLIPASQLTGTIPSAALSGSYGDALTLNNAANSFIGNGSGLTLLNASNLASGTVPDIRLSTNVAFLDANQNFTGTNSFLSDLGEGRLIINGNNGIDTNLFTGLSLQYYYSTGEGAIMSSYNDGYGFLSFYTKLGAGSPITRQMTIDYDGSIGMGTSSPGSPLDLMGRNNWNLASSEGDFRIGNPTYRLKFGVATGGGGAGDARIYAAGGTGRIILGSGSNDVVAIMPEAVGINTLVPLAPLHVINTNLNTYGGAAVLGFTGGGGTNDVHPNGQYYSAGGEFAGPNGLIGAATSSNFDGYGVLGFAPESGYGVYGDNDSTNNAAGIGVYGTTDSTNGVGVYAQGAGTGASVALTVDGGGIRVNGAGVGTATPAFIQVANSTNVASASTYIDNPLCNGNSGAILVVTPNYNAGSGFWNHPLGVYYDSSVNEWAIFNEDDAAMTAGPAFNVLVIVP
jgi:hypothetical protein